MEYKEDIIRIRFPKDKDLNEQELRELEEAAKRPVIFSEDAPELSDEQYAQMAALARKRNAKKNKPVIALRVSPDTFRKAKATGKGYTGFLSRLLDNAIKDPELVMKSLQKGR